MVMDWKWICPPAGAEELRLEMMVQATAGYEHSPCVHRACAVALGHAIGTRPLSAVQSFLLKVVGLCHSLKGDILDHKRGVLETVWVWI